MKFEKATKLNRAFLKVDIKVQQLEQKLLKKHFSKVPHRELIYIVFIKDNFGKRMNDICRTMGISKGAFSNTVKTLERKGFITKTRSKKDSRVISLKLTLKGEKMYAIHMEARNIINDKFEEILNEEQMEKLFEICEKFTKAKL